LKCVFLVHFLLRAAVGNYLGPVAPKRTYLHAEFICWRLSNNNKQRDGVCNMSTFKSRDFMRGGRPNEIEGNIRELVRQQGGAIRQTDPVGEQATSELSSLLRQVSLHSTREVDRLIEDLKLLREKLEAQGNRVQRDIVEYASLSQSVVQLTKIVSDGMTHVKRVPDAPTITSEVLEPTSAPLDEPGIEG
jgi:hypothetical protein